MPFVASVMKINHEIEETHDIVALCDAPHQEETASDLCGGRRDRAAHPSEGGVQNFQQRDGLDSSSHDAHRAIPRRCAG